MNSEPRSPSKGLNNGIPERYGVLPSDGTNGKRTDFIKSVGPYIRLILQSYRLYGHISRMGVHSSNNPVY